MILISKESRDSYNAVIANVNQKVSGLMNELEKLISKSESNVTDEEASFNTLIKKANNLKTYVSGLLTINKQLDAQMPDSCNYEWVYKETKYNCAESSDCGEGDCGEGDCGDCGEICSYDGGGDCGDSCSYDGGGEGDCSYCSYSCSHDGGDCSYSSCVDNACGEVCNEDCSEGGCSEGGCSEGECSEGCTYE